MLAIVESPDDVIRVLVFEPDPFCMESIRKIFLDSGYDVDFFSLLTQSFDALRNNEYSVVVIPLRDWNNKDEESFIPRFREICGDTTLIAMIRKDEDKIDAFHRGVNMAIRYPIERNGPGPVQGGSEKQFKLRDRKKEIEDLLDEYLRKVEHSHNQLGSESDIQTSIATRIFDFIASDHIKRLLEREYFSKEYQETSEMVNAMMESTLEDIIIVSGLTGRVFLMNAGVMNILGPPPGETYGKKLEELHPAFKEMMDFTTSSGKVKRGSFPNITIKDLNGKQRVFDFKCILLKSKKRRFGYLFLGRDQTDRIMRLENEIRNLRWYKSLNNLNIRMRKARNLEDGHRAAVSCFDPAHFSRVLLFIPGETKEHIRKGLNSENTWKMIQNVNSSNEKQLIRPEYIWIEGNIYSFREFLKDRDMDEVQKIMEWEVKEGDQPLNRVMMGEELVIGKQDISELMLDPFHKNISDAMDSDGDVALFPILAKRETGTGDKAGGYYGAIMVQKREGTIDEEDWEYFRQYGNIVGLALENDHLLKDLSRTVVELQKEKSFKEDVIMRMSHEINSPITSIQIMNGFIKDVTKKLTHSGGADGGSFQRDLADVLDSVDTIQSGVRRLEDISRSLYNSLLVEHRELKIEKKEFDVREILDEILYFMRHLLEEHNAKVRNLIPEKNLPPIYSDPDALMTVLYIILENAILYMPRDEMNRDIRDPEVVIDARIEHGSLIISVKDNGIGIQEKDIARIFKRLYRVTRVEHHRKGLGLGLPTASGIIEFLDGKILTHSEPGKGSVFDIVLPLNKD